jgi:hypothetical protein
MVMAVYDMVPHMVTWWDVSVRPMVYRFRWSAS